MSPRTLVSREERTRGGTRQRSRFVLITGGKGGVGKSTLAANLGVALARVTRGPAGSKGLGDPTAPDHRPQDRPDGEPVSFFPPLLVDLDLGLANLDILLRLTTDPGSGLDDFLCGRGAIEDCVVRGPEGIGVLPARSGAVELARPDAARRRKLMDGIIDLSSDFGIVLGDSPAGIGPDVMHFSAHADRVLVVTTPEPAAMTDAYGLMKALDTFAREEGLEVPTPELFVNQAADSVEARAVSERLASVCGRFLSRSPRLAGWMPRSRIVMRSVGTGRPFVSGEPKSLPARCVSRLARRFSGLVRGIGPDFAP